MLSLSVFLFLFSLHVLLFSLVPLHPLFLPWEFLVEPSKWVWVWKLFFPRRVNALNSVCPPPPFPSIFLVLYLGKNRCGMRADRVYASHQHFNRNRRLRILLSHRDWIEKAHHLHPQMILPCQNLLWLHTQLWHAHAYATPSRAQQSRMHTCHPPFRMCTWDVEYWACKIKKNFAFVSFDTRHHICLWKSFANPPNTDRLSYWGLIHRRKRYC